MGKLGCTIDGNLDDSKFSEPIPWIGVYIAAASAACALAMAIDAGHSLRYRKFWFACKFFSVNATTLTLLAVATKLSVDLNTSMPRQQDQLAKLSSTALICTVMGNFLPSIGTMSIEELFTNIIALAIFVVTVIVNVCIQLGTGVIYVFWKEHVCIMVLMLVLLAIMISSALTIPATRSYFELKYKKKHKLATKESKNTDMRLTHKLRDDLMKYWMMAHTCSPQFVVGRLATCNASGAFCLVSTAVYAEAMLRSHLMPSDFEFCHGDSDYKWSVTLILVTQTIAIVVGTIAPAFRWFTAIHFRCPIKAQKAYRSTRFKVENYWIQKLIQWKDCPMDIRICGRHGRKLAHSARNKFLDLCVWVQIGIVMLSKAVRVVSLFCVGRLIRFREFCKRLIRLLVCNKSVWSDGVETESEASLKRDLSNYVMHLEGEEDFVELMMRSNFDATSHWIRMGQQNQPKNLLQLLEKMNVSRGFEGVRMFDSNLVPSLDSEDPPNCWALPVVTLTSIAAALPNIDFHLVKQLISSVLEGLKFMRAIEESLDAKNDLANIRSAAAVVWVGIDLHFRWLDVHLREKALQEKSAKEVLQELSDIAKQRFVKFRQEDVVDCLRETPSQWPAKVIAANSMYRISQTLLLNGDSNYQSSEMMFHRLSDMIADIMGACLTNLQRIITMQCDRSSIEERERKVRFAIFLLGETEKILEILDRHPLPSSPTGRLLFIDDWRALAKEKDYASYNSSLSLSSETTSSSSADLYLTVD